MFDDGNTSLLGGYGMAYARNFGNVTFNVIQNPPNNATIQINAGSDVPVGSLPITLDNSGPFAGSGTTKAFTRVSLRAVDPDIKQAYAHFWSAAFERQVFANSIVSIEYSGSHGVNLYSIANINRSGSENVFLGMGPTVPSDALGYPGPSIPVGTGRLNLNGAASVNFRGSDGRSNYNALILDFETTKLRNQGLRLGAKYTYSVSKDNLSTTFSESGNNFNLGYLDPFNPNLDYGYSDNDVRHRFIANFTYEIPSPKGANGWMRQVVGGWELNGIILARTGPPFTVYDCTRVLSACSRAVMSGSVTYGSTPVADANRFNFLDLSNLTPGEFVDKNGTAEFGPFPSNMSKRNQFRAPGVWNTDLAIYKNFQIKEGKRLQLRLETYNTFNHANLFVSGGDAEVSNGATVDGKGGFVPALRLGTRNIQIAGKFIF